MTYIRPAAAPVREQTSALAHRRRRQRSSGGNNRRRRRRTARAVPPHHPTPGNPTTAVHQAPGTGYHAR